VAVKVDNRVLLSERDQRRFFREVNAAGRLSGHPHVIDVYYAGTLEDGRPYLVLSCDQPHYWETFAVAIDRGTRTYRCVASVLGSQASASQFRR
jgi:hypothetical protein